MSEGPSYTLFSAQIGSRGLLGISEMWISWAPKLIWNCVSQWYSSTVSFLLWKPKRYYFFPCIHIYIRNSILLKTNWSTTIEDKIIHHRNTSRKIKDKCQNGFNIWNSRRNEDSITDLRGKKFDHTLEKLAYIYLGVGLMVRNS